MLQTIQASDLNLHDVETKFGLQEVWDEQFFREWQENLPELTEPEKRSLDQIKANFLYLSKYPMSEVAVKLVIVSPLLSMAGFYSPPFRFKTENPVQIALEDKGKVVRGRIDVLALQKRLRVLVVESKEAGFSLQDAIAQALAYMAATPHPEKPAFGLATNGSEFIFLKLTQQEQSQYGLSDLFTLRRRSNDLYVVLSVLKRLAELIKV
jgi:predicted type IV restriction endonuclease